jgi:subtilisin family serine protease
MRLPDLPIYRGYQTLEPRLRSLLRLDPTALFDLHQVEWQRFNAAIDKLNLAMARWRAGAPDDPARTADVRGARSALIAPRTFALRYPANDQNAGYVSAVVWSPASADDLIGAGIKIRSQARDMFAADIPLSLLRPLMTEPAARGVDLAAALRYVELARPWTFDLIDAIPTARIDTLHAGPVTGKGVVVGVIDTGIDIYHPHFIDRATGASRIELLWDQTLLPQGAEKAPPDGAGFSAAYGVEYSNADITADLLNAPPHQIVRSLDVAGHGTMVASCAASSGHVDRGATTYVGAAPGARIIAVKLDNSLESRVFADSSSVLDAAAYIFSRAEALSMPCVVNLSMSDNLSAHDGTSNGEQFLDSLLLTAGRAFVCSAGNQNFFGLHLSGVVAPGGTTAELSYRTLPAVGGGPPLGPHFNDWFEIWYDGHDRLTLTIDVPSSPHLTVGPVAPGTRTTAVIPSTSIEIEVDSIVGDARNGDNVIYVQINNRLNELIPLSVPGDTWRWTLAPDAGTTLISGAFNAFADRHEGSAMRSWVGAVPSVGSIGVPATGARVIGVGAHGRGAAPAYLPGPVMFTSGCGPTRDGRIKPELCATGELFAARSKDLVDPLSAGLIRGVSGTSCAAPLVSGAAALLFECQGPLPSGDIKQLLLDSALASGASVNAVGFGTLDVGTACIKALTAADVWIRDATVDSGVEPYTGAEPPFSSPDIVLLDAAGNPAVNPQYDPDNLWNNRVDVTVRNRGTGVARNVDVYLYWTDPATYIPFPLAWYTSGIYTGGPAFLAESNRVVINSIPPGGSATAHFAWAPPSPGSNIRADAHFCLLARVEHEADPSNLATGGWGVIAGSNNIAMRNVDVVDVAVPAPPTGLNIVGTGEMDSMEFWSDFWGNWQIILPTQILPWRELGTLAKLPIEARGQIDVRDVSRDLDDRAATRILGVSGASRAQVRGPLTLLHAEGESARVHVSALRLRENAAAPVRVAVNGVRLQKERGFLNIAQRSGGKIVGGVQIEFRHEVPPAPHYIVTHKGDEVIIRRVEGDERPDQDSTPRRIPPQWRQMRRRTTV